MTEYRLWNFRQLVRNAGGTNGAAEILGVRPSYITAIAGPNPNRTIGDRMAAKIEATFGLEPGSLDQPPPVESKTEDPYLAEIVSTMANTTDEDKEFVLAMSHWIASRRVASSTRPGGSRGVINLTHEVEKLSSDLAGVVDSPNSNMQNVISSRVMDMTNGDSSHARKTKSKGSV